MALSQSDSFAIRYIRLLAMIMIVLCHYFGIYSAFITPHTIQWALALFLNIGVQVFFCVSGYLYGSKDINDWKHWFCSRFQKIFIPYLTLVILVFSVSALFGKFSPLIVYIEYVLGLSGFTWAGFGIGGCTSYLAHTWFITLICGCYVITPLLQKMKKRPIASIVIVLLILWGGVYY